MCWGKLRSRLHRHHIYILDWLEGWSSVFGWGTRRPQAIQKVTLGKHEGRRVKELHSFKSSCVGGD
jgi:hypothetical protein